MENLVRRTALAKQLGVVPTTIDAWCAKELYGLKRIKVGKTVFIDISGFQPSVDTKKTDSTDTSGIFEGHAR